MKKQYIRIEAGAAQQLLNYLTTKPFNEVFQLVPLLVNPASAETVIEPDAPEPTPAPAPAPEAPAAEAPAPACPTS